MTYPPTTPYPPTGDASGLYALRRSVRGLLASAGLWTADEILIKRRTNIWNDVAVATGASKGGECVVVGVAKGTRVASQSRGKQTVMLEVTLPVTLIALPEIDPAQILTTSSAADEDSRWEAMVMLLEGNPLDRSPLHYTLEMDSFEDVEDEEYVIRQTIFKTRLLLRSRA